MNRLAELRESSPDGRWGIYRPISHFDRSSDTLVSSEKLLGFAVRRTSTRWDIVRSGRKIGFTVGPDGPEGATALLTIC